MQVQKPIYKPQVACPSCGNLSSIDYCTKKFTYTWWCSNEKCGRQYSFIINDDWSIYSKPTGIITKKVPVKLKVKKTEKDIFIILKGISFNNEETNFKYFYNEHTCPVNLIRDGLEILHGDEPDPHGIFEYVETLTAYKEGVYQ